MSASLRRWWPLLKQMHGPDLRNFLEDRFVVLRDDPAQSDAISRVLDPSGETKDLALRWWRERDRPPDFAGGATVLQYRIAVPGTDGAAGLDIQVGMVTVTISGSEATWTSDDFFVPLSLWGGGLGTALLRSVLDWLQEDPSVQRCVVKVKGPDDEGSDPAQWAERTAFVNFYRQAGFSFEGTEPYLQIGADGPHRGRMAILSLWLPRTSV
jgi:GNAT superfamily N-acetyltransferase